jgi:hypothetical protein
MDGRQLRTVGILCLGGLFEALDLLKLHRYRLVVHIRHTILCSSFYWRLYDIMASFKVGNLWVLRFGTCVAMHSDIPSLCEDFRLPDYAGCCG